MLQQIVISESSAGLYYDRTKVLYSKKYGHEFSDDKVAKMKSLRIEEYDYYNTGNDVVVIATVYVKLVCTTSLYVVIWFQCKEAIQMVR